MGRRSRRWLRTLMVSTCDEIVRRAGNGIGGRGAGKWDGGEE